MRTGKKKERLTKETALSALRTVCDPQRGEDIVTLGMISGLQVSPGGDAVFMIEVDPKRGPALEPLRQKAERAVAALPGAGKVSAVLTAERPGPDQGEKRDAQADRTRTDLAIPARHIIAVASGKGGVGKSTVAANLAVSLAKNGQKTGLLDADIYGPSLPRMTGLGGRRPESDAQGKILPLEAYGLQIMSIGFMVAEEKAMIWRGPMVQSALVQLLRDVAWGMDGAPLDFLIIDLPPGTGDAQLTLAQKVPLSGAVIVSTPQDIALLDARKGIEMFRKVNVPILGVIENMSAFRCPSCGHESHIFGHGGAREEADRLSVPFLGEIPLHIDIRTGGDEGRPVAYVRPESPYGQAFQNIAQTIISGFSPK